MKASEPDRELLNLLEKARKHEISKEEFQEQRVSFAFGNALNTRHSSKELVRKSIASIRPVKQAG
ncbi:MAG: hypothetical protein KDJ80_04930 [Nitratireductor sp.]|nr:hypothetical protein [Nitratireductor sp.]